MSRAVHTKTLHEVLITMASKAQADRTTLTITCPNGHFELEITAKSQTALHGAVLERSDPQPCPACGDVTNWEWSS